MSRLAENLFWVSCESMSWAARRIREKLPIQEKVTDRFTQAVWDEVWTHVGIIGGRREGAEGWIDVQLADGRWKGRRADEGSAVFAAILVAYWWQSDIVAAGVGLAASAEAEAERTARIEGGDLLALLGDDWGAEK